MENFDGPVDQRVRLRYAVAEVAHQSQALLELALGLRTVIAAHREIVAARHAHQAALAGARGSGAVRVSDRPLPLMFDLGGGGEAAASSDRVAAPAAIA